MSDEDYTLNVRGLDQLLKALKGRQPTARVGILETTAARSKNGNSSASNAEIGAIHEFGAPARGIPSRSFLRMPISSQLDRRLESSGALDEKVLADVIKEGSVLPWVTKVTALAEGIVLEAFETGGFGQWPKWKDPGYMNNSGQLLIDTGQLMKSVTSEVKA